MDHIVLSQCVHVVIIKKWKIKYLLSSRNWGRYCLSNCRHYLCAAITMHITHPSFSIPSPQKQCWPVPYAVLLQIHIRTKWRNISKIVLSCCRVLHIYSLTMGDQLRPCQQDRVKSIQKKIINNNQSIYWHPYASH